MGLKSAQVQEKKILVQWEKTNGKIYLERNVNE